MPVTVTLRTDHSYDQVVLLLQSIGASGFGVREVAGKDNVHWHWLLHVKYKNEPSFRQALLKAVPTLKGNKAYSMSPVKDQDKYERYMCKGNSRDEGSEVCWCHGLEYTSEWIQARHDAYWEVHDELVGSSKQSESMLDYVCRVGGERNVQWIDRQELARIYCEEVKRRRKPLNLFAAKAVVNSVQLLLGGKEALEEFSSQI